MLAPENQVQLIQAGGAAARLRRRRHGGREMLGIVTHGLMSHAVTGGVVESIAGFFLDHGAGAAAEAVREILPCP